MTIFDFLGYVILIGPPALLILGFVVAYRKKAKRASEIDDSKYATRIRRELAGGMVDIPLKSVDLYNLKQKYNNSDFQCAFFVTKGTELRRGIISNICEGVVGATVYSLGDPNNGELTDGINIMLISSFGDYTDSKLLDNNDSNLLGEFASFIDANKSSALKVFIMGSASDYKELAASPLAKFDFAKESITAIEDLASIQRGASRAGQQTH